jgi:hypothetical protein
LASTFIRNEPENIHQLDTERAWLRTIGGQPWATTANGEAARTARTAAAGTSGSWDGVLSALLERLLRRMLEVFLITTGPH